MKCTADDLIGRALENISNDREKLEKLYSDLEKLSEIDPFVVQAVGDNLIKIADSLTRQTGQIVDLAKLKTKVAPPSERIDGAVDPDLRDSIYNEIENADDFGDHA